MLLSTFPSPVFAVGIGDILPVIVVVVMLLSGIVNFIKENAKKGPQVQEGRPRRPGGGQGRLQNEIEIFLKEASGQGTKDRDRENARQEQPSRRRAAPKRKRPQQATQKPQKRRKPGSNISERHIDSSEKLGSGVREHLADHMEAGHVSSRVSEHLSRDVDESVSQHLGTFSAEQREDVFAVSPKEIRKQTSQAQSIADLLRSPSGIRQAILLNEILSPPKSLRGKK